MRENILAPRYVHNSSFIAGDEFAVTVKENDPDAGRTGVTGLVEAQVRSRPDALAVARHQVHPATTRRTPPDGAEHELAERL
jgi:hypothetical protein